jgi:uncharacterized protein
MPGITSEKTVTELLRETRIEVAPSNYVLLGLRHDEWNHLLAHPDLSPQSDLTFMIFRDGREVTLLIEEDYWKRIRHALTEARVEEGFRLVTLDFELPWNVVGYLARLTEILAQAGVAVGVLSSFSRDHLLIKQAQLGTALRALGEHVGELC